MLATGLEVANETWLAAGAGKDMYGRFMTRHQLTILSALLLISAAAHTQTVYRCVGEDGAVTFQDRDCEGDVKDREVRGGGRTVATSTGRDGPKVVPLPRIGEAAVMVYDYMETIVRQDEGATVIGLRAKPGSSEPVSIKLEISPNTRGRVPAAPELAKSVAANARALAEPAIWEYPEVVPVETELGTAQFSVVQGSGYQTGIATGARYTTVTIGRVVNEELSADITILTDGTQGNRYKDALMVAKTITVAPEILGVNVGDEPLAVPDPPAGYEWLQATEVRMLALRPVGWHVTRSQSANEHEYRISREAPGPDGDFDTGLTINVITDVTRRTGKMPSQFAAEFMAQTTSGLDVLEEPFRNFRSPYEFRGGLFASTDPVKGTFNAHIGAISNDRTGTIYLVIFEGPAAEWSDIWAQGETMIKKLAINSGF